jgi:hypothetical protein
MKTGTIKKAFFLCCLALLALSPLLVMSKGKGKLVGLQTGMVSGKVFKPDMSACKNARVEIDMGSGNVLSVNTDDQGFYYFSGVPTGTSYTVKAKKEKFKNAKKTGVSVSAGKSTTVNLTLRAK